MLLAYSASYALAERRVRVERRTPSRRSKQPAILQSIGGLAEEVNRRLYAIDNGGVAEPVLTLRGAVSYPRTGPQFVNSHVNLSSLSLRMMPIVHHLMSNTPLPLHLLLASLVHPFLLILRAPTIVEISNVGTIEQLLPKTLVHLVMHMTRPRRRGRPGAHLRRELGQYLPEMLRALATRIQALEEVDVGLERALLISAGSVGEARHDGVEELPAGAAQLGLERFVAEFGRYGVAYESAFGYFIVEARGGDGVSGRWVGMATEGGDEENGEDGRDGDDEDDLAARSCRRGGHDAGGERRWLAYGRVIVVVSL